MAQGPDAFLEYGGIRLGNLLTLSVGQEVLRDDSRTDKIGTKLTVRVRSVFNPDSTPSIEVQDGVFARQEYPAETMARVREKLLKPRQSFHFSPTGWELIGDSGRVDEANGPFPLYCNITRITPETWEIEYAVEYVTRDCPGTARDWLSLRWSDTVTYNEDWFCVRRRAGTLILSSAGQPAGISDAEGFRGLVTPSVPQGFRRESAEYSLSKNNLAVNFAFTDVELNEVPPRPALRLTGRMVVTTPLRGGVRMGEISLRLTAPKGVRKQELVAVAIRAAFARVRKSNPVVNETTNRMLVGGSVVESLDDKVNAVELSLQWSIKPNQKRAVNYDQVVPITLGGGYEWVGDRLAGSDPLRAVGPPLRGTAETVRLAAAALGDPCGQEEAPVREAVRNLGVPTAAEADGPTLRVTSAGDANDLGPEQKLFSDDYGLYSDDGPGVYEVYEITSHYDDDPGAVVRQSTKPGGHSVALQYHAGGKRLSVEFSATKVGGPPTIPDPEPDDENVVYLGGTISPAGTDLAADATQVRYTVSGVLNYAFLDSSKVVVSAPLPPWISRSLALGNGQAAARTSPDIAFPTDQGADPFDGDGTTTVIPDGGQGAGGDYGSGGGQTVYP